MYKFVFLINSPPLFMDLGLELEMRTSYSSSLLKEESAERAKKPKWEEGKY